MQHHLPKCLLGNKLWSWQRLDQLATVEWSQATLNEKNFEHKVFAPPSTDLTDRLLLNKKEHHSRHSFDKSTTKTVTTESAFFSRGGGGGSNAAASVNMESQQQLKWNDSIRTMQHENSTEDPRIRESTYQKVLLCPFSIPPTDTISNTPHNENRLAVDTKASRTTLQQLQ